jgi:hypothetical protein
LYDDVKVRDTFLLPYKIGRKILNKKSPILGRRVGAK